MTIEQKAKAYDEALERARSLQHDNGWVTTIFPELKESEDERIRKALIEFLRESYSRGNAPEECAKWLVWLHKPKDQKEQEPADERMRKAALKGIEFLEMELGWDAIGDTDILDVKEYLEKQKEQKPIFRVGDYVRNIKTGDKVLIEQLDIATKRYCYISNDGAAEIHSDFPFSKQDEWEVIGQQIEEWSEEDKNKFDLLHTCICLCINDPYWEYSKREKVSKELIPFIEKFKFLRPSWKPSEEQIHALWKLMHNAVFLSSWGELEKEIESLYKDLKKL